MGEKWRPDKDTVHPDVEYLKRDEVGQVIGRGLAEVAKVRPANPVTFLGQWLLAYQMNAQVRKTVALPLIASRWKTARNV